MLGRGFDRPGQCLYGLAGVSAPGSRPSERNMGGAVGRSLFENLQQVLIVILGLAACGEARSDLRVECRRDGLVARRTAFPGRQCLCRLPALDFQRAQ